MTRSGDTTKLIEATLHARKHLGGQQDTEYGLRAGGLLAYPSNTPTEPYKVTTCPHTARCVVHANQTTEHVRIISMGFPRQALRRDLS